MHSDKQLTLGMWNSGQEGRQWLQLSWIDCYTEIAIRVRWVGDCLNISRVKTEWLRSWTSTHCWRAELKELLHPSFVARPWNTRHVRPLPGYSTAINYLFWQKPMRYNSNLLVLTLCINRVIAGNILRFRICAIISAKTWIKVLKFATKDELFGNSSPRPCRGALSKAASARSCAEIAPDISATVCDPAQKCFPSASLRLATTMFKFSGWVDLLSSIDTLAETQRKCEVEWNHQNFSVSAKNHGGRTQKHDVCRFHVFMTFRWPKLW